MDRSDNRHGVLVNSNPDPLDVLRDEVRYRSGQGSFGVNDKQDSQSGANESHTMMLGKCRTMEWLFPVSDVHSKTRF